MQSQLSWIRHESNNVKSSLASLEYALNKYVDEVDDLRRRYVRLQ